MSQILGPSSFRIETVVLTILTALTVSCTAAQEEQTEDGTRANNAPMVDTPATPAQPSEWQHYSMDDLDIDVSRFVAFRARYLQVMYDLQGNDEVRTRSIVHLEVDRAVHSGVWDGKYPAAIEPFREQGLVIDWKIQNSIYNAFDRILTDSRLATRLRSMPLGAYGLRVGAMIGDEHSLVMADPSSERTVPVKRTAVPGGAVNVLTVPYLLAAMELRPGDRFTLPGFAIIGGPDGSGVRWQGAYEVQTVTNRTIHDEQHVITEVVQRRINKPDNLTPDDLITRPGQRITHLLISDKPPYLIGRGDYRVGENGNRARVREHLDIVDWAPIPLPAADFVDLANWDVQLDSQLFMLAPEHTPNILVPRN